MGHKLLLADDSITIQKVVGIIFANGEYELSVVDNGVSAVEEARNLVPDVMLIDAIMPGKTGYEVCEEVRKDPSLSHVPVLLLTGVFEPFDEDKARRSGADDFISKPFESQHLLEKVHSLMKMGRDRKPAAPAVTPTEAPSFASGFDVFELEEQPEVLPVAPAEPFGMVVEDVADGDVFDIVSLSADEVVAAAPEDDLWGAVEAFAPDSEEPVLGELVEDEGEIVLEAVTFEEDTSSVFDSVESAEELVFDLEPEPEPSKTWVIEDPFAPAEVTASDIFAEAVAPADSIQDAFTVEMNTEPEQDFFGTSSDAGVHKVSGPVIEPPSEEYEAFFLEDDEQEVAEAEVDIIEKIEVSPIADDEESGSFETAPSFFSAASAVAAEAQATASEASASPAISLSEDQLAAVISKISREIIERIAWEVVPDLAESMIKEEIRKITNA